MADLVTRVRTLVRTLVRSLVRSLDERTPAERDRALDGLRALALAGVVTGHWMVGALVLRPEGLVIDSPLRDMPWLAPTSWVLQMLGLFFLVGGRVAAAGWTSGSRRTTADRGGGRAAGYRDWLRRRLVRLGRPVAVVLAAWAVAVPVLLLAGVPERTVRSAGTLVLQPLWFVGVYAVLTALTPCAVAADRRLGALALLPCATVVALVDVLRYGPLAAQLPGWVPWLNVLAGWLFCYQLGTAWAAGRFLGRVGWVLLAAGVVAFGSLVTAAGYPASMVGLPGEARTNAHPPSLLVLALATAQSGLAVLAHSHLARALRRPVPWAATVGVNVAALSILCWHQTAALVPAVLAASRGWTVPGLTDAPTGPGWLVARAAWLPVLFVLLVTACVLTRRWESGGRGRSVVPPHHHGHRDGGRRQQGAGGAGRDQGDDGDVVLAGSGGCSSVQHVGSFPRRQRGDPCAQRGARPVGR